MNPLTRRSAAFAIVALIAAAASHAQTYPTRAIRLIVPYPPAGPTDIHSRIVAEKLQDAWGQPVIVENRPGAAGMVGTEVAANAPADGYTLCTAGTTFSTAHALNPKMSFVPLRAFSPIALMGQVPNILVVHPSLPARNVKELIAIARARPGELLYATGGAGGAQWLAGEYFQKLSGTRITSVQYRGTIPATTALVSGEIPLGFSDLMVTLPLVRAGRLRLLGVTSAKRSSMIPDVPTVAESGLKGFAVTAWFGLVTRSGAPAGVVDKLNAEILHILKQPVVLDRLKGMGSEPGTLTATQFADFIKAESEKWTPLIEKAAVQEK